MDKITGWSLIIGSIMLVVTMVLHPSGGNIAQIMKIHNLAIITHALAILSLPVLVFGFYGLTTSLLTASRLSVLAFITICFALIGGMMAAALNGLVLPFFVDRYYQDYEQNEKVLTPIINYGLKINLAMDYILITGILISIAIYSFLIYKTKIKENLWLAYVGILLIPIVLVGILLDFNFTNVPGFRLFIFAIVTWIIGVGVKQINSKFIKIKM